MKNIIQFGFVKGPHENIKLDTYFRPLVDEINDLNANGGTMFEFYDGEKRRVMVHIVWIGGDSPAVAKVGGLKGVNGVSPCRICDILGHWLAEALHCYSPSRVKLLREGDSGVRIKRYYDPANLSLRVVEQSESTFRILQDMSLTKRRRDRIAKATGITGRTVLYDLPSIVPFESFPLDIMHLIYNIGKDFLVLWKGLHAHFKPGDPDNDFIISREGWKVIDAELCELGKGTSQSWFGRRPRDTSKFENWKAEEFKTFFLIYAPVVLEGHIFPKYLEGVKMLSSLFDLCFRPQLTKEDLERISSGALLFFNHFENDYFKFIESRARLCKSTIHALLHLAETVRRCGPLVLCNQFDMERINGYAKNRLNATVKAAESLTEGAKLSESNKLLQGEHFAVSDEVDPRSDEEVQDDNDVENDTNCTSSFKSGKFENLSSTFSRHFRVRELMVKYAMRAKNISQDAARASMQDEEYNLVGRAKVKCGEGTVVFGSRYLGRKNRKRANYYVVAGFEEDENKFEVFYGQVLFFIQYEFRFSTGTEKRDLFVGEWISGLMTNDMEHLFTENRGSRLFRQRSVEDISVILHGFGILEHRHSGKNRKCTYILDPQLRIHHLLDLDKASPDGMNRVAYGVHWD